MAAPPIPGAMCYVSPPQQQQQPEAQYWGSKAAGPEHSVTAAPPPLAMAGYPRLLVRWHPVLPAGHRPEPLNLVCLCLLTLQRAWLCW